MPRQRPLGRPGIAVGLAEGLRPGPGHEGVPGFPRGMGDEEGQAVLRLPAQQVEGAKAGHLVKVGVPLPPALLEALLPPGIHAESVHGNVHGHYTPSPSISPFSVSHCLLSLDRYRSPESGTRVTTRPSAPRPCAICRPPATAAPPEEPVKIDSLRASSIVAR